MHSLYCICVCFIPVLCSTRAYDWLGEVPDVTEPQAAKYCDVNVVFSSEKDGFRSVAPQSDWKESPAGEAAYLYYCANETVHGERRPYPTAHVHAGASVGLEARQLQAWSSRMSPRYRETPFLCATSPPRSCRRLST